MAGLGVDGFVMAPSEVMATVDTMDLNALEGSKYGPTPWRVAIDAVSDFVEVTGDDPRRWSTVAPPGFAASALFAVAPDLLSHLYDRSVIHGEQSFTWNGPIPIGELFEVSGTVSRVRERGGVHFVTFDVAVGGEDEPLVEARSLFLASGETVPGPSDIRSVTNLLIPTLAIPGWMKWRLRGRT